MAMRTGNLGGIVGGVCLLAAALGLLNACAGGKPRAPVPSGAASLRGDLANIFRSYSEGEANVGILEIDGVPNRNRSGPVLLAPGRHCLKISGDGSGELASAALVATGFAEFEFEPGRSYRLRANLRGISIVFRLMDDTTDPEVEITRFRVKVNEIFGVDTLLIPIH